MKTNSLRTNIGLTASVVFAVIAPLAHAATLISDQFDRVGVLNGSAPTYSAVPETWTADPTMITDGSSADTIYDPSAGTTGYLGIPGIGSAALGSTFTLSFSMPEATDPTNSDHGWGAAGFGVIGNTASFPYNVGTNDNEDSFMILYNPEGLWVIYSDQNALAYGQSDSSNLDATLSLTIGAGGDDSLAAIVNGSAVTLSSSTMSLPVSEVFYGSTADPTSISDFVLTGPAVPEPSSTALLLVGCAGLAFAVRKYVAVG